MPSRAEAIVICATCGVKWGSVTRAAQFEEAADVEKGILAAHVPRMIRHYELGHVLGLGENAPREFMSVIAEAAKRVKAKRDDDGRKWTGAEFVAAAQLAIEPRSDDEIREIIDDLESR